MSKPEEEGKERTTESKRKETKRLPDDNVENVEQGWSRSPWMRGSLRLSGPE